MEPKNKDEVLRDILKAWEQAKGQLGQLKAQVQKAEAMAALKGQTGSLTRERDRALRDLGEGVWKAVQAGRLRLPPELSSVQQALEKLEARREVLTGEISDILQEGEAAAGRLASKPRPVHSGVDSKPKKR